MKTNVVFPRFPLPAMLPAAIVCAGIVLAQPAPVRAQSFTYSLASQQEYGNKKGFKLFFEDNAKDRPRGLGTIRLLLAVADGKSWRFPEFKTDWQWDRDYRVKAVIGEKATQLWLDGQRLPDSPGGFVPSDTLPVVKGGLDSRKMLGLTECLVHHTSLTLTSSGGQQKRVTLAKPEQRPLPLFALDPQSPIDTPWKMKRGETLTLEASFRLRRSPDLRAVSPFVDRYGQSRHADWPSKIHNDADLRKSAQDEERRNAAWGLPREYDAYGGYLKAGWKEKPTGFFRTVRRNGYWWLISPDGNPTFYTGVDTVIGSFEKTGVTGREYLFDWLPSKTGEFAAAWNEDPEAKAFGFTTANLIRRHGKDWEQAAWQQARTRLKTWGFSGVGKWSGTADPIKVPSQPVLRRPGVPTLVRIPDIFDPAVQTVYRDVLRKGIEPHKDNPNVLGWSVNNEHDEIVLKSEIDGILKMPATVPAKRALIDHAVRSLYGGDIGKLAAAWKLPATGDSAQVYAATAPQPPDADVETLRRYFADQYYGWVYRTVKEIDPNHLYFGFWILPGWWENEEDWRLIARHCDVLGYDLYSVKFADARVDRLLKETDKPVLCGEFSFPSWYGGARGYGVFATSLATASDAESGTYYARWLAEAARNPYCVGVHWFQYRDQPLTGRGQKGTNLILDEHFAFGIVDITDQPKWDMVAPMRRANLAAAPERVQAMRKQK